MPRNNQARRKPKLRIFHFIPVEGMPIPYTLTDVGRAFLSELRSREAAEEQVLASLEGSESPSLRSAARHLRSPRMT